MKPRCEALYKGLKEMMAFTANDQDFGHFIAMVNPKWQMQKD